MKQLLARLAVEPGSDHRVVFHEFAARLERLLRRPAPFARVRAVAR